MKGFLLSVLSPVVSVVLVLKGVALSVLSRRTLPLVLVAVVSVSFFVFAPDLLAETEPVVTPVNVEPLVNFDGVFESLKGIVTAVVVGAVGIGLSIWATRFIFHIVKSMGRG
jgi:sugar phosphate permease